MMPQMTLIRTAEPIPGEQELGVVRRFLFGLFKGATEKDEKRWNRFWRMASGKEPGEIFDVETVIPRNAKFHRKFFALLQIGFDAWEPQRVRKSYKGRPVEKNFEQFREDITILAGFYEQTFDMKGRMRLRAKSISFANMDDVEFEALYSAVVDVLLRDVCANYAGRDELDAVVERVMGFI
jgi:hypothetical protein